MSFLARLQALRTSLGARLGFWRARAARHLPDRAAVAAGLGSVACIAVLVLCNIWLGPQWCLGMLSVLPVAVAAWWVGLPWATLLALASACFLYYVDALDADMFSPLVGLGNATIRFATFSGAAILLNRLREAMARERARAYTDSLTGAVNGRAFYDALLLEGERARKNSASLTVAYVDLDHFKRLNDERGHSAGDEALVHFAHIVRANIRIGDTLARIGGDEFCLLLPATTAAGAVLLLTRLQQIVAREMAGKGLPITTSIGAATFVKPPHDADAMIQRVDALMYGAKKGGKNRINHDIIDEMDETPPSSFRRLERRATARLSHTRAARVRLAVEGGANNGPATIHNLSSHGIGFSATREYPLQTSVVIEPASACGVTPVLARVVRIVHVEQQSRGWYYGCELVLPLSEAELRRWVGQPPEQELVACSESSSSIH